MSAARERELDQRKSKNGCFMNRGSGKQSKMSKGSLSAAAGSAGSMGAGGNAKGIKARVFRRWLVSKKER